MMESLNCFFFGFQFKVVWSILSSNELICIASLIIIVMLFN